MILPALFHWSPSERRRQILREGLIPYSHSVTHSGSLLWPYVCLSPTPSSAWSLSGDTDPLDETESWDLWQVRLGDNDEVRVLPFFGDAMKEVRVGNAITADRIWWVGVREIPCAECKHGGRTPSECPKCFPEI